ncbi:MAG TPA: hypothetical protein VLG50_05580 [Candidatus Saccharimonadales bacterium]|nr:hypothetical protein [Candidatus Saccharimonadales bacterium]
MLHHDLFNFQDDLNIKFKGKVHYLSDNDVTIYQNIDKDNDIYLIRTDKGSFKLYRKDLINTLKKLRECAHLSISKLNEEQAKLLDSTTEVTRILHNTKALTDIVIKDIQHIYGDIKNPIPGTVGAFFVGCFNQDHEVFKGPIGCNPRCAASLLRCNGDHFECSDTILYYTGQEFKSLNDKHTNHAYIYIESHEFKSFNHHDIQMLKDAGICKVTLIHSNKDGSYKEVTNEAIVDDLHIHNIHHTSTSNNVAAIVIIVILVLILLFCLLYFYGKDYL